MAVTLQTDAELIRPLEGAIIRRYTAGEPSRRASQWLCWQRERLRWQTATEATPIADFVIGCALKRCRVGDRVDVVVYGPISNCTAATPGKLIYISDTEGLMDETSTSNGVVGWAESATVVFRPTRESVGVTHGNLRASRP